MSSIKKVFLKTWQMCQRVSRQLPPRKVALWLGLGLELSLILGFGLGAVFLGGNCRRTVPESLYVTFFKENLTLVFSCEFFEIKDNFFMEHLCSFWFTINQLQET